MSAKNPNSVMGAKGRYLEAQRRADEKDAARAAKKDRALARAKKIADTLTPASASSPIPAQSFQPLIETNVPVNGIGAAKPRVCICHGDRPVDSHGLCKAQVDSARFAGRVAADTDEDAVEMVQKII